MFVAIPVFLWNIFPTVFDTLVASFLCLCSEFECNSFVCQCYVLLSIILDRESLPSSSLIRSCLRLSFVCFSYFGNCTELCLLNSVWRMLAAEMVWNLSESKRSVQERIGLTGGVKCIDFNSVEKKRRIWRGASWPVLQNMSWYEMAMKVEGVVENPVNFI